jgi:hypothetical protein
MGKRCTGVSEDLTGPRLMVQQVLGTAMVFLTRCLCSASFTPNKLKLKIDAAPQTR